MSNNRFKIYIIWVCGVYVWVKVVQWLLDAKTRGKVTPLGSLEALHEVVDPSILPFSLGGTRMVEEMRGMVPGDFMMDEVDVGEGDETKLVDGEEVDVDVGEGEGDETKVGNLQEDEEEVGEAVENSEEESKDVVEVLG